MSKKDNFTHPYTLFNNKLRFVPLKKVKFVEIEMNFK
jgi:hypothetical protein